MRPDLPKLFHDLISRSIDAEGVYPHQAISVDRDDNIRLQSLMLDTPLQVMTTIAVQLRTQNPSQMIYGLDRFTQPGQGTSLGDAIAGAWLCNGLWKPFVIEYQHEPRIVLPMEFGNRFWNAAITLELTGIEAPKPKKGGAA